MVGVWSVALSIEALDCGYLLKVHVYMADEWNMMMKQSTLNHGRKLREYE